MLDVSRELAQFVGQLLRASVAGAAPVPAAGR
jgi:hypothetical protein